MCSSSQAWHFVLPADRHQPSGGNRYNEQLIRALRRAGQTVAEVDFATYQEALTNSLSGVFFVDSLFTRALASLPRLSTKSVQTIFVLHHLESMDPPRGRSSQQVWEEERAAFAPVDTFLVTSTFSERYLRDRGIAHPIVVVEPGIEAPADNVSSSVNTVRALMVANLVTRKGVLPWLQALADRTKATDNFRLKIIGRTDLESAYARACQRFVSEHPILSEKVDFIGPLPHERVPKHYAQTNIFVSAARMETFGMALQEAKAHQIPLLVLAGGYAERHVSSEIDGQTFTALPDMVDFFVDLVKEPTKLAAWRKQIAAQRSSTQSSAASYGWDDAARRLIRQLS